MQVGSWGEEMGGGSIAARFPPATSAFPREVRSPSHPQVARSGPVRILDDIGAPCHAPKGPPAPSSRRPRCSAQGLSSAGLPILSRMVRVFCRRSATDLSAMWLLMLVVACSTPTTPAPGQDLGLDPSVTAAPVDPDEEICPAVLPEPAQIAGTTPAHLEVAYWEAQWSRFSDLDAPLFASPAHRLARNAATVVQHDGLIDLTTWEPEAASARVEERLSWMHEQLRAGAYVDDNATILPASTTAQLSHRPILLTSPSVVRLEVDVQLRCSPLREVLRTPAMDRRLDRNLCSRLRVGELARVIARTDDGQLLLESAYALGWTDVQEATIGRVVPPEQLQPPADEDVAVPTRRDFLRTAFAFLGSPYGWGGQDGGRDCSRLTMDVMAQLGVTLPRFSTSQSVAGTFWVDVAPELADADRLNLFDIALEHGVVLLHFPGHIMFYLGRDDAGQPMALHSFAEYLEPCATPGQQRTASLRHVNGTRVTTLELGRETERRAFVERVTRVTVLGSAPDVRLVGLAHVPDALPVVADGACPDSDGWLFVSPRTPNARQPLRFTLTGQPDATPLRFSLLDLQTQQALDVVPARLDGPPVTWYAQVPALPAGRYRVVAGDGSRVVACTEVRVQSTAPTLPRASGAWHDTVAWGPRTEAMFAAFIERLFDYPLDDERTWSDLQSLLQDPDRNLLFNHLGLEEDARLRMTPDCADLPYYLRAYFAWKLDLPFGYRRCGRGRAGNPPQCGPLLTNREAIDAPNAIAAFERFTSRAVRDGVHSSSGRTLPDNEESDYYPVELSQDGIRPGTVFHDPYGHVMIVTRWVPQGDAGYGVLMAADAQPDHTIGRRRFWRGTFLFEPSLQDAGAGFKAFRPVVLDRGGNGLRSATNAELDGGRFRAFSTTQYAGSRDDFYESMDALIHPRPLDPTTAMAALVDALYESGARRVQAVELGEGWIQANRGQTMPMPDGAAIFLTSGPWEDFSTPSRDLRLLVAIDAVMALPDRIARAPHRFGVPEHRASLAAEQTATALNAALAARSFSYQRSDGSRWELTLQDLVARATALEMAYNPNDCVETRWGAPAGSDEAATCQRQAPSEQRARMARYRPWFSTRQRPAR